MSKIKLIAMFMIFLVVSLPFYSAVAFAGINNVRAYGIDNVDGYIKDNDVLQVNANAFITGETITPEKIKLGNVNFNTCAVSAGGGYDCVMTYNLAGLLVGDETTMTVYLYNNAGLATGNHIDSKSFVLRRDAVAPTVAVNIDENLVGNNGSINIRYNIQDNANVPGVCSGIKKIELYKNSINSTPEEINVSAAGCNVNGVITKTASSVSSLAQGAERVTIYLKAYDKMGNSAFNGDYVDIDHSAPVIDAGSLKLKRGGSELGYIANNPITVDVEINVNSDSIASMRMNYNGSTDMACNGNGENFTCVAAGVLVRTSPFTATFTATDNAGNENSVSASKTLQIDSTSPEIVSLTTDILYNGEYYIKGAGNSFSAVVREAESGLGGVLLDVSALGGANNLQGLCNSTGSDWTCTWDNVGTNKADGSRLAVKINPASADNVDNRVSGNATIYVKVDKSKPVKISDVSVKAVGSGQQAAYAGIIKSGDNIVANLSVLDATPVSGSGDFSGLGINGLVNGECTHDDLKNQKCDFITTQGIGSGPYTSDIKLSIKDVVGNELIVAKSVDVYGVDNDTNPNYWKNSVKCSPKLVDRQITPFINQIVYCHVKLEPISGKNQKTLSILMGSCADANGSSTEYLQDETIMNNAPGSTDPYIKIELRNSEMLLDELKFNCPLIIRTKAGKYITNFDETENATISIKFYNNPLGTLDQSIQDKIDKVKDDVFVGWEWIDTLQKIIEILRKICSVLDMLVMINNMLQYISTAMEWGWEIPFLAPLAAASREASDAQDTATSFGWVTLFKFCGYVSCRKSLWGSWYDNFIRKPETRKFETWFKKRGFSEISLWPQSPKDSIVLSMATGCIPGIVYNIQKWRQIQCQYGLCLREGVRANVPTSYCENQKGYLQCKFISGEIFQLIPYANFFKSLASYVEDVLSNPLSMVLFLTEFTCAHYKVVPSNIPHAICVATHVISETGELIQTWRSIINVQNWVIKDDLCKQLTDEPVQQSTTGGTTTGGSATTSGGTATI